jgi:hypothetical protein
MAKKETITVQGTAITVITSKENDYISLTDMAGYKDELEARIVVSNWMSTRFTLEFLGIWEQIYNPNFNRMEFHTIKNAGRAACATQQRGNYANAVVSGHIGRQHNAKRKCLIGKITENEENNFYNSWFISNKPDFWTT